MSSSMLSQISNKKASITNNLIFPHLNKTSPFKRKQIRKPSTLLSTQTSILSSLNTNTPYKPKKYKLITFDEYTSSLGKSMEAYNSFNPSQTGEENQMLKLYESKRTITLVEKKFKNPLQSIQVIKNNKMIYDNILKHNLVRQKLCYDNFINAFNHAKEKYKVEKKGQGVKVLSTANKITIDIPLVDMATEDNEKKKDIPLPSIGNEQIRLFSYYSYPNKNFPEGREEFCLFNVNSKLIIVGGNSISMQSMPVWELNVERLEWKKIISTNMTYCRFGHTCIPFDNKLYIFGGRSKIENKKVFDGLEMFNLKDKTWSTPTMTILANSSNTPQLRRNHIAVKVSGFMLIQGGITEFNEVLSDCFLFQFSQVKWTKCLIDPFSPSPEVYGHSASLVLPSEIENNFHFSIYKFPLSKTGKIKDDSIKEKGVYIFGGKRKDGTLSNDIYILILGKKPLEWIKANTNGTPPSPRFLHSMNFYDKANLLIVHGGRNDNLSESIALNDTFVFNVENFEWMKVELYSYLDDFAIISRCGHSSIIYGNKLIVFGGMNAQHYIGSSLLVVNLEFEFNNNITSMKDIKRNLLKKENERDKKEENGKGINNQLGIVKKIKLPFL